MLETTSPILFFFDSPLADPFAGALRLIARNTPFSPQLRSLTLENSDRDDDYIRAYSSLACVLQSTKIAISAVFIFYGSTNWM